MSTGPADRPSIYSDLRERTKRQERWRDENLKRIVAGHRERHLHAFQCREEPLGANDVDEVDMAA